MYKLCSIGMNVTKYDVTFVTRGILTFNSPPWPVARKLFLDRRQKRERQKERVFSNWTAFFVPENSVFQKKGLRRIWTKNKGLRQISTAFFGSENSSQVGHGSPRVGQNISRGARAPYACGYATDSKIRHPG